MLNLAHKTNITLHALAALAVLSVIASGKYLNIIDCLM